MSAYGAIGPKRHRGESPLPNTRWTVRDKTTGSPIFIDMHHLTLEMALKCPGLVEYLHSVFARVVEDGRTYPMEVAEGESYSRQAFEGYFFAADVIVGVLAAEGNGDGFSVDQQAGVQVIPGTDRLLGLSGSSQDGKPLVWESVVAGFYYVGFFLSRRLARKETDISMILLPKVKPNYPGRSSHVGYLAVSV